MERKSKTVKKPIQTIKNELEDLMYENNELLERNNELLEQNNELLETSLIENGISPIHINIDGKLVKISTIDVVAEPVFRITYSHGLNVQEFSTTIFDELINDPKYDWIYTDAVADTFENIQIDYYKENIINIIVNKIFLSISELLNEFDSSIMNSVMHTDGSNESYSDIISSVQYINMRYECEVIEDDPKQERIRVNHLNKHGDYDVEYSGDRYNEYIKLMHYWEYYNIELAER